MGNMRYAELTAKLRNELSRLRQGDPLTDRQAAILDEARMLLAEDGLAAFSLRQLAQRVNMKLASLQYHFATRRELVDALLQKEMSWYGEEFLTMVSESNASPLDLFGQVIEFLVQEARKDARFEFQIWAMAAHDDGARRALDEYMSLYRRFLFELIGEANPQLTPSARWSRAAVISTMLEGAALLISEHAPASRQVRGMPNELQRAAMLIVESA